MRVRRPAFGQKLVRIRTDFQPSKAVAVIPAHGVAVIPAHGVAVIPAQGVAVIPAQAGIHVRPGHMDPRFRGDDGGPSAAMTADGFAGMTTAWARLTAEPTLKL
jgi:hypothetical protein